MTIVGPAAARPRIRTGPPRPEAVGVDLMPRHELKNQLGDGEMRFGLTITPSCYSMHPATLAKAAEERGFASLTCSEHTHIPVARETPYPSGEEMPRAYMESFDPLSWLMVAATATTNLWIGTAIALVAQHDPVALAKQVASVDVLSGGRLILGVGYGWNRDELPNHGVDPRARRAVVRERMLTMRQLWTQEEAEFHGEHVKLSPSWSWPKPVQESGPPVLLGAAAGTVNFSHLVEYCDGWLANNTLREPDVKALRDRAEGAGRDPDDLILAVHRVLPDLENLETVREMGASLVSLSLPDGTPDDVLDALDEHAALVERFRN